MKRFGKIMMIAALAMVSYNANAELEPQWSKGTIIANAGVGVSPFGGTVSVDYVLVDEWWKGHFTVGGEINICKPVNYDGAFGLTPRATYGLNITPEFEVHATAQIGFGVRSWTYWDGEKNVKDRHNMIFWENLVGCRYFFMDNLAAYAEVGYAEWFPALRAGISFKF